MPCFRLAWVVAFPLPCSEYLDPSFCKRWLDLAALSLLPFVVAQRQLVALAVGFVGVGSKTVAQVGSPCLVSFPAAKQRHIHLEVRNLEKP